MGNTFTSQVARYKVSCVALLMVLMAKPPTLRLRKGMALVKVGRVAGSVTTGPPMASQFTRKGLEGHCTPHDKP